MNRYREDSVYRKPKIEWSPPLAPTSADWGWWKQCAAAVGDRADELTHAEQEFICSMGQWRGEPSPRQLAWLVQIFSKLFGRAPA